MSNGTNNTTLDPCAGEEETGYYDLNLHIASVFVLLITSMLGVIMPIIVKHFKLKKFAVALEIGKFFGAGVITATGFVHIFPDAVSTLTDPCLPAFFSTDYPAAAGLFSMFAALLLHLIQYLAVTISERKGPNENAKDDHDEHVHGLLDRKHRISTYILEFAIGIHSVIIGADLGVTSNEFETLLVALTFHQFFEGIGLGYRIADIKYDNKIIAILNSLAYALTTPVGVIIGIGVHEASISSSASSKILKGILDAFASGILIASSLVTLIFEEFSSKKFNAQPLLMKAICFLSLYVGAGLMSLIGIWA